MTIKTSEEIAKMRLAGKVVEDTLNMLEGMVDIGVSTGELDKAADAFIRSRGGIPSFLNYNGFPKSICTSVNATVVHGIPGAYRLKDGDIVSIDVGVQLDGWQGDAARTFLVGNVSDEVKKLVTVTREAFFEGIKKARAGNRVYDISSAIESHAHLHGYGVVRELVGHGIGRNLHESPDVPNFTPDKSRGRGVRLRAGMTIAIEPMINLGTADVRFMPDGWAVDAADGLPSAHYENTIAITDGDPILLTLSVEEEKLW